MTRRDALLLILAAVIIAVLAFMGRATQPTPVAYHEPEDGVQGWDVPWTWTGA